MIESKGRRCRSIFPVQKSIAPGVEISAISSAGSSKQVVRTSRMFDSLFPKVLSEFTYSLRTDLEAGVNGFLEGLAWVRVVLI